MMNAVHDLAVLVARDEGLFNDEGLEVEVIGTPGTAQANAGRQALRDVIFDRTMESLYNTGDVDQYRMCEWGVMKRTVEAVPWANGQPRSWRSVPPCPRWPSSLRPTAASTSRNSSGTRQWPSALSMAHISATLKMLEGFVKKEHIFVVNAGTMHERLEAVRRGDVAAGNFMEPWISIAQKQGFHLLMESHSTRRRRK
jgi:NitT/TauT family transport system substrate-binding protein